MMTSSSTSTSPMIFLVGNSLGANILTKYLGEEGAAGTLPTCVAGAASLGNPLVIHSGLVMFPFNVLMGLGVKRIYVENWKSLTSMRDFYSRHCLRDALLAPTIATFDGAMAPCLVRNDSSYPFGWRPGGYDDGESYWFDASCYRYLRHISVPFLNLTARDDFLVSKPSRNKLGFCISNPNVMVVETRCGGHLGWQGKIRATMLNARSGMFLLLLLMLFPSQRHSPSLLNFNSQSLFFFFFFSLYLIPSPTIMFDGWNRIFT